MKRRVVFLLLIVVFLVPGTLFADECMEGDCDNGIGSGFTEDSKIYEGEWKDGYPHGKGKLFLSRGKVIEGVWERGELVETTSEPKEPEQAGEKKEEKVVREE